jgi:hypothetical protein
MDEINKALNRASVPGYYGRIEIDIVDGEIAMIREERATKILSRKGHPRYENNPRQ